MFRRRSFYAYACGLLLGGAPLVLAEDAGLGEPLVTRSPAFAIPFELQAAPGEPAEAFLYYSADHGKSWQTATKVTAPVSNFEFRAPNDGEYWFVVRTELVTPAALAVEKPEPELRVVVDSTPPKLDISVEPASDGTVIIRWKADDAKLAAEPLRLSYRFAGSTADPQPVETARAKRQFDEKSASGELQWRPVVTDRKIVLQAELRDAAGNVVSRDLAPSAPIAKTPSTGVSLPGTEQMPPSFASAAAASMPNLAAAAPAVVAPGVQAVAPSVPPMAMRDPTKPLMVNSTAFELDYDVQSAAAGSITKVEVWGTRDGGRSWVLLGIDEDRRTPCSVNVDAEGLYGFSIVVEAAGGLAGKPPLPGDAPEIRVGVDLSAPQVRLTTAEPDEQNSPCRLKINWDARDQNLGPQAVTLSYAASPQGPWLPLAQGIASTGSHVCEFDPHGPDNAYLKIDVRDDAGNIGSFATTTPIPIEKRQVQFTFAGAAKPDGTQPRPKWFHVLR